MLSKQIAVLLLAGVSASKCPKERRAKFIQGATRAFGAELDFESILACQEKDSQLFDSLKMAFEQADKDLKDETAQGTSDAFVILTKAVLESFQKLNQCEDLKSNTWNSKGFIDSLQAQGEAKTFKFVDTYMTMARKAADHSNFDLAGHIFGQAVITQTPSAWTIDPLPKSADLLEGFLIATKVASTVDQAMELYACMAGNSSSASMDSAYTMIQDGFSQQSKWRIVVGPFLLAQALAERTAAAI